MALKKSSSHSHEENSLVRSSIFSLSLVLVFSLLGVGLHKVCTDRQLQFESKLSELESLNYRYLALQDHNARMKERITYLKTDEGVEEVVREKLGLVRPGELAYSVVPPPPPQFSSYGTEEIEELSEEELEELLEDKGAVVRLLRHLFSESEENGPRP